MTQQEQRYASLIVADEFGPVCNRVFETLCQYGALGFKEIKKYRIELSSQEIQLALVVMLRHGIVAFEGRTTRDSDDVTFQYFALPNMVCSRIRFPYYVELVNGELGPVAAGIYKTFLVHGILTGPQAIHNTLAQNDDFDISRVATAMKSLVKHRFIRAVTGIDLGEVITTEELKNEEEKEKKKKRPKRVPKKKKNEEEEDDERVNDNLVGTDPRRPKPKPTNLYPNPEDHVNGNKRKAVDGDDKATAKRRQTSGAVIIHEAVQTVEQEEAMCAYKPDFDTCHVLIRNNMLKALMRDRHSPQVEEIITTLLNATRGEDQCTNEVGVSMTPQELEKQLRGSNSEKIKPYLKTYLDMLRNEHPDYRFIQLEKDSTDKYRVCFQDCFKTMRFAALNDLISTRFNPFCARIFKLLVAQKYIEQKNIGDLALLPFNETKECLYKMLSIGLVHVQEIPKSADHQPSNTIHLWHVNLEHACNAMRDDLLKTAANLRKKLNILAGKNVQAAKEQQKLEAAIRKLRGAELELSNQLACLDINKPCSRISRITPD